MSYQPSIAKFIASNKRERDDEVLQLSGVPGDSPVDLSNEDDGDYTDKEKSNPEPLPKKKKGIALRKQFHGSRMWIVCITARSALLTQLPAL